MYKTVLCHQYEAMGNCTSNNMHTDKMNCSPSQIIPYIKLFFVGHITMTEFVIMRQSVNLFMNYPKKESQPQEKHHNNLSFCIKYWIKLLKIGSEPKFQPSSNNTVHIWNMDYYTLACFQIPLTLIFMVLLSLYLY